MIRLATAAFTLSLCAISSFSHAEDCRMYPPGPQRFACVSQRNPGAADKLERCKEEGRSMGRLGGPAGRGALQQYVQGCMQRKH